MTSNGPLIGIDLMGGVSHHQDFIEPLFQILSMLSAPCRLLFFGTADVIRIIEGYQKETLPFEIITYEVDEVIGMDEDPLSAIRKKKNASMCVAMRMLESGEIDALVSTGNTGALLASAKMHLNMLDDFMRPALLALLPTMTTQLAILDVGANVTCKSKHLLQFAKMGLAYQKTQGHNAPKIGLLNIGSEKGKGRLEFQEAHHTLQNNPAFIGNVEGTEVFEGKIDVLVTDGFAGNILLKTSEGLSSFIFNKLKEHLSDSNPLMQQLNTADYPGALLIGLDKLIIKCHGNASPRALFHGINQALRLASEEFIQKFRSELKSLC